jgi:transcriptional regulator with XRE-family HTH domain
MSSPLRVHIGKVLYGLRVDRDLSAAQLARELRTYPATVLNVEGGKCEITLYTLDLYATALGTTCTKIVSEAEISRAREMLGESEVSL